MLRSLDNDGTSKRARSVNTVGAHPPVKPSLGIDLNCDVLLERLASMITDVGIGERFV